MNSDNDDRDAALAAVILRVSVFMGRRDKPGEDENRGRAFAASDG
jgi:hypothetical protein